MVRTIVAAATTLAAASSVLAQGPPSFTPSSVKGHFVEQFTDDWSERWSPSKATKEEKHGEVFSYVGKWSVEEPTIYPGIDGDMGLVMKNKAAHHAISVPFESPLDPNGKTLVVQYEVKLQKLLDCGGAYIKLLSDSDIGIQAEEFTDKTPYTIMFGPDRCGSTSKVHFIFRHKNPISGEVEEKHLTTPPAPKITKTTALYTLIVRPDQTYEIKINNESSKSGSLLEDFSPAVNPPKEIDDPNDTKPADWVDSPKMTDTEATKPDDWDEDAPQMIPDMDAEKPDDWLEDEPATVPDPDAEKPEEWSDEDDGDWIAPSIPNPKCEGVSGCGPWVRPEKPNPDYKGQWFAPLIDNPDYKGPWSPRKIENPDYFEDKNPAAFNKMAGVGIELWSMTEDILFDNIYIGHSESDAATFAKETYLIKAPIEEAAETADAPKAPESLGDEPDMKKDPVGFAKFKAQEFINAFALDPVHAVKSQPYTVATGGVFFATVVGMLSILLSLILPSKESVRQTKDAVAKKTDAITADVKDAAGTAQDESPVKPAGEEKKEESTGVKTRSGKGKAVEQ